MEYTATQSSEIGMVGLGVMGRNMLLNLADHGFAAAGYDRDLDKIEALRQESEHRNIQGAEDLRSLVAALRPPRAIVILVPAGPPVDAVIRELLMYIGPEDLIIDAGNSFYKDTDRRAEALNSRKICFLGVGISGGEKGAREGASIMAGGSNDAYERVRPMLESVAARVGGELCVDHLGSGSAGHFVKMIHNGIEYGLIQLIAESYDLLKRGLGLGDDELREVYAAWSESELNSYLVEITSKIFSRSDERTGNRLIDEILPVARQKGTGMWTSQTAMDLQAPIPTIDMAVAMRNLSALDQERERAEQLIPRPQKSFRADREHFIEQLRLAVYCSMVLTFTQGFALLRAASSQLHYGLDLETVARIWRGGCIIRAGLLEDIRSAYRKDPMLPNLLLDRAMADKILGSEMGLRSSVNHAIQLALPVPAMMASLSYLDSYRSGWLPANLIQAQRDFFGAHTYERIDEKGAFHTDWDRP